MKFLKILNTKNEKVATKFLPEGTKWVSKEHGRYWAYENKAISTEIDPDHVRVASGAFPINKEGFGDMKGNPNRWARGSGPGYRKPTC